MALSADMRGVCQRKPASREDGGHLADNKEGTLTKRPRARANGSWIAAMLGYCEEALFWVSSTMTGRSLGSAAAIRSNLAIGIAAGRHLPESLAARTSGGPLGICGAARPNRS